MTRGKDPAHAHGVDAAIKSANLRRLRRIEGQIRGLQRMIEADPTYDELLDLVYRHLR